jgi:Ni,Fe-hydrogenase III large subunit
MLDDLIPLVPAAADAPWPSQRVSAQAWREAAADFVGGRWTLVSLWGERDRVHAAVLDAASGRRGTVSLDCADTRFPSLAAAFTPAARLERTIQDLFGLIADGAIDARSWVDHGQWPIARPMGDATPTEPRPATQYEFLPVRGEDLHQIPVGPVHAGIIEPGHFRFTASGETVVRLEERLGYVHKGTQLLMRGADLERGARLAGRVSGDSTVAYAVAFARAVEGALGIRAPERASALRAVMAELERLANHFGDIGAICNDASFSLIHAHCGVLRELVLRCANSCFGHRLMMDKVVPGGLAVDLAADGGARLRGLIADIRGAFPELVELYDTTTSVQDRTVGTGIAKPEHVRLWGAGGFVGRGSGRGFDARKLPGYAPYDRLSFDVPVLDEGDVNARVWIRIREVEQSLRLIEQLVDDLRDGAIRLQLDAIGPNGREGCSLVESFRGDIFVWLRLDAMGRIEACHLRDPSWFQWPLLEACIEGNIVADFPLCNKSFNCSYSGHDL